MKTLWFTVLSLLFLSQSNVYSGETQRRPDYLDEPVELRTIGEMKDGERYPLIVFLPFTTGSAETYFSIVSPYIGLEKYFAIIPKGTAELTDYLPDFFSYLKWFEKRLLTDIPKILKDNPIDVTKIYINGYSLGGDLSWALLIRQKELFAGALIIGSRCSYVPNGKELKYLREHKKRIVLLMGDKDLPERVKGMITSSKLAEKNGLASWYLPFMGEHIIPGGNEMTKAYDFLMGKSGSGISATVPFAPMTSLRGYRTFLH